MIRQYYYNTEKEKEELYIRIAKEDREDKIVAVVICGIVLIPYAVCVIGHYAGYFNLIKG